MIKNFNVDLTKLKIVMDSHLSRRVKFKKLDNGKSSTKPKTFVKLYKGGKSWLMLMILKMVLLSF
mgnify:FL=1